MTMWQVRGLYVVALRIVQWWQGRAELSDFSLTELVKSNWGSKTFPNSMPALPSELHIDKFQHRFGQIPQRAPSGGCCQHKLPIGAKCAQETENAQKVQKSARKEQRLQKIVKCARKPKISGTACIDCKPSRGKLENSEQIFETLKKFGWFMFWREMISWWMDTFFALGFSPHYFRKRCYIINWNIFLLELWV